MKKLFYKSGVDICSAKSMYNFINNHYTYDTLNSWNGLKSIANNVKLYNLELEGDWCDVLKLLEIDQYNCIDNRIESWERDHPMYSIGFNGRSSGYLVLYNKENNCNVIPDYLYGFDSYEDFKENYKEYYGTISDAIYELREYTKLIRDFDKLCDEIRDYCNELSLLDANKTILENLIDEFNYLYEEDIESLKIKPLVLKDNKIDISNLKLKSIRESFISLAKEYTRDYIKIKGTEVYL